MLQTLNFRSTQFLLAQNKFAEARQHLEAAIASPSRRTNVLPWAYFYLARVAKELKDEELLRRAANDAITQTQTSADAQEYRAKLALCFNQSS